MSADVSREEGPRRFQFPLWALLFLMPTFVATVCGGWVAIQSQLAVRQELKEELAMLRTERDAIDDRVRRLRNVVEGNERSLAEWRSPGAVIKYLQGLRRDAQGRITSSYPFERRYPSEMAYFFHQASDDDLRQLADLLSEVNPGRNPQECARRLECFSMFPEFVPDRLHVVAEDVKRMATPLQGHPHPEIAKSARMALQAFDLPVNEGQAVFPRQANGEPMEP